MQKNTAGKWIVFAYGLPDHANDGQPITGDAANITGNVYIDGVVNVIDDTNPTELGRGYYVFDITAAEANGDNLLIDPVSATGSVQVIGGPGAVWTRPPNFEALGIETDGDLTKVNLVALTTLTTTTTNSTQAETDISNLNDVAATDIVSAGAITTLAGAVANVDLVDLTTTTTNSTQAETDISNLNDVAATDIVSSGAITTLAGAVANVDLVDLTTLTATLTTYTGNTLQTADVATAIADIGTAQLDLDTISNGIIESTTKSGTDMTTACSTNLTGYGDDQLIGRIITFYSGAADGESSDITDYVATNGVVTFTAMTIACGAASNVSFKIT